MARKNLGIIQINLPDITLEDTFTSGSATDITSFLSDIEKQKIVQACKDSKLIYMNITKLTDSADSVISNIKLIPCYCINGYKIMIQRLHSSDLDEYVDACIDWDEENDVFYFYA